MRSSVMSVIMAILDMPLCTCLVFSSRDNGCGLRVPTLAPQTQLNLSTLHAQRQLLCSLPVLRGVCCAVAAAMLFA